MKKNVIIVVFALILGLSFWSVARGQFYVFENSLVGKAAPDFTLKTISGNSVSLNEFRGQNPAILFFWATWCPHCQNELLSLDKRGEDFEKKGIKLVLVDLGESAKVVEAYVKKRDIRFEVFLDEESVVAEEYGIIGVPTYFLIDKSGKIQAIEHEIPDNFESLLSGGTRTKQSGG
jgi:peroxiredoxin